MKKRWDEFKGDHMFESKNRVLHRCNTKRIQVRKKSIWVIWFLFLKTVFDSQKQGEHGKQKEHVWFPVFFFFLNTKNKENTKFRK